MITAFRKTSLVTLAAALGFSLAHAAPSGAAGFLDNITVSANASGGWVENLSRSSNPLDMRESMQYDANVTAGASRQISRNWLLTYGADAGYYTIPEFDRNAYFTIGMRGGLQRKFGLGALAPVLSFNTSYVYKDARINSNDGGTLTGSVNLSKRIIPSVRVGATAEWLDHYAQGGVFDTQQRTLSIDAAWDITDKWRLSGSAGQLSGKIVATAGATVWGRAQAGFLGPAIAAYYNTTPSETTNAFGPGWVSYIVEADVDLWSVALTHSFSENTSVNLNLSSAYATNIVNVRYLQRTWGFGLAHRF
ncbi:hypothetical protein [Oleiharenicola lentus]|uniref:hypothetical protein n=1 Tax=Oleiharenicola lentus TaxID=2508720 RepID=UPI003F66DF72